MTECALGKICRYRTENASTDQLPYLSTESMQPNKMGVIPSEAAPSVGKARLFRKGDTLISNIRPYFKKIWQAEYDGCCSADVLVFEPHSCDSDYLYWLLSDDAFFAYMVASSKGTKMPRGDKDAIMRYKVRRQSATEQRRLAAALNPIRELIRISQRTNDYLATLVDLEFSKRFSGSVSTTSLKNVLEISTKSLKPQQHAGETWEHYSIPAFDGMHWPIFELADGIKSNKYIVDRSSILISKLNPSIKRMWIPACLTDKAVCSTEFIVYKPLEPRHKSFYCAAINAASFTAFLLEHVTGSTGSRQRAQPKATLDYPMPSPCRTAIEAFCDFADPIYRQIELNGIESQRLGSLRDALLPKLMSGEIDASKVGLMQPNNHLHEY